jgi:hypothetical protein
MTHVLVVWLVLGLVTVTVPADAQTSTVAYGFMEQTIDSLAVAADAHALIERHPAMAIAKLAEAERRMEPFLRDDNEKIAHTASIYAAAYRSLAERLTQSLVTLEKPESVEAGRAAAEIDDSWKRIAGVTALSGYVIIDPTNLDILGRYPHLTITTQERKNLRARLESLFDRGSLQKPAVAQSVAEVAPALLWQFLGQPEFKPSDVP